MTDDFRMIFDYHTHTVYSKGRGLFRHARGTVEENVEAAEKRGLHGVAISEHGPGHLSYGVRMADLRRLRDDIGAARRLHPQMEIFMSVEANIMNSETGLDIAPSEAEYFDFLIAGYHFAVKDSYMASNYLCSHGVAGKKLTEIQRERNTMMITNAVEKNNIKILTHPGDKGPVDMLEIARACAAKNVWMEISAHHSHLTADEIRIAAQTDVKFVISSDAHSPSRVGTFGEGITRAQEAGLDLSRIVNIQRLQPQNDSLSAEETR